MGDLEEPNTDREPFVFASTTSFESASCLTTSLVARISGPPSGEKTRLVSLDFGEFVGSLHVPGVAKLSSLHRDCDRIAISFIDSH